MSLILKALLVMATAAVPMSLRAAQQMQLTMQQSRTATALHNVVLVISSSMFYNVFHYVP
jgi:spore maturation protein SpmA